MTCALSGFEDLDQKIQEWLKWDKVLSRLKFEFKFFLKKCKFYVEQ